VGVDVDEPRGDDLVTGIDRFGRIARDIGLDRGDLSAGDCYVTDGKDR